MRRRRHRAAGHLRVAVRDRDGVLLVEAEQHLRPLVAEVVDEAVVQPAEARARIERDVGDVERAQRLGDRVAAEQRAGRARVGRALDRGGACLDAKPGAVVNGVHIKSVLS